MKTPEEQRLARILKKFALTDDQWYALLAACNNHCPLCLKPFSSVRLPCPDHDHTEGLVRGVLCTFCNLNIGYHHDNADWFARAADYLYNPPAVAILGKVYVPGSIGASRER